VDSRPPGTTLVFYDGVCGLCNRLNRFLLRRDTRQQILFAPLQGALARRTLARHGADASDLDTVYVMADWQSPQERALPRSRGVLHALAQLGGGWAALAALGRVVPRPLADLAYRIVARNRYRVFGRYDACPLPRPEWRSRFVDREE
jgi:predicted DCC family thiol-disulfide oxidoreductase YuxK